MDFTDRNNKNTQENINASEFLNNGSTVERNNDIKERKI
jgi:hypothetical protein